ncbi:MAG: hypothetical protein IJH25_08475 [Clostridia bacterium]|nr:hypothetical protein [Clostridia bacterium]MBQ6121543.1 hypothetical protein [Clostridia bacterium]
MEPMAWVASFMWWLTETIGTLLTLIGLAGLLLLTGRGLVRAMEYIIDKEEANEYQDRSGEEDRPFQP